MGVQIVKMEEIKFKELAAVIKVLNNSMALDNSIQTVSKTKEQLVEAFVKAVQEIPDDEEGNWTGPKEVAEYYQKITVVEAPPEKKEKAKKEKAAKEPKAKKEKAAKEPKAKEKGRREIAGNVIKEKGEITLEALEKEMTARYHGKVNDNETHHSAVTAIAALVGFGAVTFDGTTVKVV